MTTHNGNPANHRDASLSMLRCGPACTSLCRRSLGDETRCLV